MSCNISQNQTSTSGGVGEWLLIRVEREDVQGRPRLTACNRPRHPEGARGQGPHPALLHVQGAFLSSWSRKTDLGRIQFNSLFPLFNQCPSRILFHSTPPLWGWFTLFWGDFLLLFIKSTKSMTSIISAEAMCLMVVLSVWSWWHPRLIIIEDFSFYSWNYPRDESYWEQSKKYYFVKLWYILIFPGLEFCLHYWGSDNAGWLIGNM